jgi:hypothetical protein
MGFEEIRVAIRLGGGLEVTVRRNALDADRCEGTRLMARRWLPPNDRLQGSAYGKTRYRFRQTGKPSCHLTMRRHPEFLAGISCCRKLQHHTHTREALTAFHL